MASGDIETAFRQGGPGADRDEPLYMSPPHEPIVPQDQGCRSRSRLSKIKVADQGCGYPNKSLGWQSALPISATPAATFCGQLLRLQSVRLLVRVVC